MGGVNDLSFPQQKPEAGSRKEPVMLTDRLALHEMYTLLLDHFGPQHWWPGDTPDEILAGCVLSQNTRWERVVPVIVRLKQVNILSPCKLAGLTVDKLAGYLLGCGTYRRKSEYLHELAAYFTENGWTGDCDSMAHIDTDTLRSELLSLRGIGPETADCILLYVLERPVFVIDAYARRILGRHSIESAHASYPELQAFFHKSLERDQSLFNEYHALLVRCGKEFCRPKPRCDGCPLEFMIDVHGKQVH